jgi:hypothetical protein
MLHEDEEGLSRKLVRSGESFEGWGCSDCAWVFNPSGPPVGRSLDEMKRNYEMKLSEEFASHTRHWWDGTSLLRGGRVPAHLEIPGAEHLTTSDQFLELDELPRRILFVGGGYIAFELAHVAARAGSQITVLHRGPRPLALFDPDLVDQLVERTRDLDIDVRLATEAIGIEQSSARLTV